MNRTANDIFTIYRFDHSPHVQAVLLEGVTGGDSDRELDSIEEKMLDARAKAYAALRDELHESHFYNRGKDATHQFFNLAVKFSEGQQDAEIRTTYSDIAFAVDELFVIEGL